MGVWIETPALRATDYKCPVTPFVGVWIETVFLAAWRRNFGSHPSWVCGLKQTENGNLMYQSCHTLRGCVDWNTLSPAPLPLGCVTPFVGVWIETRFSRFCCEALKESHPSWVCGLKLQYLGNMIINGMSHPSWVCGLKRFVSSSHVYRPGSHTLRGCVDWNLHIAIGNLCSRSHTLRGCVDWNLRLSSVLSLSLSHTLRGCVDWNWPQAFVWWSWEGHTLRGCVDWNPNR